MLKVKETCVALQNLFHFTKKIFSKICREIPTDYQHTTDNNEVVYFLYYKNATFMKRSLAN